MEAGGHHPSNRTRRYGWLHSLYIAVLLAIAIYVGLLLVWPLPAPYCVAQRVVQLRAATPSAQLPELSADELALLCGTSSSGAVRIEPALTSTGIRLRLVVTTDSPRRAMKMLEASATHFLERSPAYVAARSCDRQYPRTDGREQACWTVLEQQLNRLLECAESLADERLTQVHARNDGQTVPVSTGTDELGSNLNPGWIEVNEELEAERARLASLLEIRTLQHPEVQAAQVNIERLAGRLNQIPLLSSPQSEKPTEESAQQADLQVNASLSDLLSGIRQGMEDLDAAKIQLRSAWDNYADQRSTAGHSSDPAPMSLWFAETDGPAAIVHRGEGRGPSRHPGLLLFAIIGSLVMTFSIRPREKQLLSSTGQARSWGAQVVATFGDVVASDEAPDSAWTPHFFQIAQWSVLLLLSLIFVLAASDPMFIRNLSHDPWMAIRDAWAMGGILSGR